MTSAYDPRSDSDSAVAASTKDVVVDATFAGRLPTIDKSMVHESRNDKALDEAMAKTVAPYVSARAERPAMALLVLMPNVSVEPRSGQLSGYVAAVSGTASASLITDALGSGTTWIRVQSSSASTPIDEERIKNEFRSVVDARTGVRVAMTWGRDYPSHVYYVSATGNDRDAARAFAAEAQSATLDEVAKGALRDKYNAVLRRSAEARQTAAAAFMREHSLEADARTPVGDQVTHFIAHSNELSRVAASSRVAARNTYLVYNNAIDPNESHSGTMAFRGPFAGHLWSRGPERRIKGTRSFAWSNATAERPFSVWFADTGRFEGAATRRTADRHAELSDEMRAEHATRVRWSGAVASYNPLANEVYHSVVDAHLIKCMSMLGAPPGGTVQSMSLETVVTEVEPLDTTTMSLAELAHVAERSSETSLPVSTAALLSMLAAWPKASSQRLADVFASQRGDVTTVDTSLLQAVAADAAPAKKE